jgi:hypothetical protein
MPSLSRATAPDIAAMPGYEGRSGPLDDYTVAWERYSEDADAADLFRGLPDDRCQSPHWGIVLKGRVIFRYADGDESISEGEAYYARPGHTPVLVAGTEVVEFSPTERLMETMAVVSRNAEAMAG